MKGFTLFTVPDTTHGEVHLAVVIPHGDDPWGVMSGVQETPWARLVSVVSGEAMSHARHGYATPLMREIGPHPHLLLRQMARFRCALESTCAGVNKHCQPSKTVPDCYEPPQISDPAIASVISQLVLWCREGRYVVVVQGAEFSV